MSSKSSKDLRGKSSLHKFAKELLNEKYPTLHILEEVTVPIRKGQVAYLDFYIPLLKLAIECHGRQHFTYVRHFHKSIYDFQQHRKRDREKAEWLDINDISLIELVDGEQDLWREQLGLV